MNASESNRRINAATPQLMQTNKRGAASDGSSDDIKRARSASFSTTPEATDLLQEPVANAGVGVATTVDNSVAGTAVRATRATTAKSDENAVAEIMAMFDDGLLKLTSIDDVVSFLKKEINAPKPDLSLISSVLGELEEVQKQNNTLPLTTFFHTNASFKQFLHDELAPETRANQFSKRQTLQYIIRRAWLDKTMLAGRKRKSENLNGQIWHFVNTTLCSSFCFVTVVLCAARYIGMNDVYAVISESHCWLGFINDEDPTHTLCEQPHTTPTPSDSAEKRVYDGQHVPALDALEMIDVLPPDRLTDGIAAPLHESRVGWAYQRLRNGQCHATVCTDQQFIAAMLTHTELVGAVKAPLLHAIPDAVAETLPHYLTECAVRHSETGDTATAALYYDKAVELSSHRFNNVYVYPWIERAFFRAQIGMFAESLNDYVEAAFVIRRYSLLPTDAELVDEATVAAAHICDDVVPPLVRCCAGDLDALRPYFVVVLALFDSLLAWFEAAKVDPGVAWETATSVTLSGHFPGVTRADCAERFLAQLYAKRHSPPIDNVKQENEQDLDNSTQPSSSVINNNNNNDIQTTNDSKPINDDEPNKSIATPISSITTTSTSTTQSSTTSKQDSNIDEIPPTQEECDNFVSARFQSTIIRKFVSRLLLMVATGGDDVLVRDVVELFHQCAFVPPPPVKSPPKVSELADHYNQSALQPWNDARAADQHARRQYNQPSSKSTAKASVKSSRAARAGRRRQAAKAKRDDEDFVVRRSGTRSSRRSSARVAVAKLDNIVKAVDNDDDNDDNDVKDENIESATTTVIQSTPEQSKEPQQTAEQTNKQQQQKDNNVDMKQEEEEELSVDAIENDVKTEMMQKRDKTDSNNNDVKSSKETVDNDNDSKQSENKTTVKNEDEDNDDSNHTTTTSTNTSNTQRRSTRRASRVTARTIASQTSSPSVRAKRSAVAQPRRTKQRQTTANVDDDEVEKSVQNWIQCEVCERWATLPPDVGELPSQWFCRMNTWSDDPADRLCLQSSTKQI